MPVQHIGLTLDSSCSKHLDRQAAGNHIRAADTNSVPAPRARLKGCLRWQPNSPVCTWSPRPPPLPPSPATDPVCSLQAPQQLLSDTHCDYLRISSDIDFGIRRITDPGHNSTGTPLDRLLPLTSSASKPQSYLEQLAGGLGIYMRGLAVQIPAGSLHQVHLLDIRWVPPEHEYTDWHQVACTLAARRLAGCQGVC